MRQNFLWNSIISKKLYLRPEMTLSSYFLLTVKNFLSGGLHFHSIASKVYTTSWKRIYQYKTMKSHYNIEQGIELTCLKLEYIHGAQKFITDKKKKTILIIYWTWLFKICIYRKSEGLKWDLFHLSHLQLLTRNDFKL